MATEQKFQVSLKIRKPAAEVFDAVVNPKTLTSYFVQTASGPLEAGKTVKWIFGEMPDWPCEVIVLEVKKNERIVLEWPGGHTYQTRVVMEFKPLDGQNTMVQISEEGWRADSAIGLACGSAGGWMHMMCCMKALLEYDVRLRAGGAK